MGVSMISTLVSNWWAFVARGGLAVLFGLIALFLPGAAMLSLVLVFAAYALADGILAMISAVRAAKEGERWSLLAFEGIADIVIGAIAAAFPAMTVVVFIALIAAWALITGSFMLVAAFELDADHGRWWLALGGAASILYGAILAIAPLIGALVLTWWIGIYALIFGVALLFVAFRLRAKFKASPMGKLA
jgi:uncharacterized membrane protein HdeD (DUF308 family)